MDNSSKTVNDLGSGSIGRLLVRLAVPTIAAQLINALYNIVDRIYIGHIPGSGNLALTGVGVTFPIIMLISAFAALVGMGGAPLASIELGKRDEERANRIMGNAAVVLVGMAAVLTAFFLAFRRPMLLAFGASLDTVGYADSYITIYVSGTLFVMLALGLNTFITAQGFARQGMLTVLIGAVLNILLDPVFIFGLGLGVRGAALATILSQGVSAAWVVFFLCRGKTVLRLRLKWMPLRRDILGPVLALGISPFIMQSTESLVMVTLNSGLQRYGNDLYVGAMTIISSVMQVLTLPIMGLGQGAQPIISYNYGAGNRERVQQAYRLLIRVSFLASAAMCLLVELFPQAFVLLFNDKPELMDIACRSMRIYMAGIWMIGVQFGCQQCFMAMGQAKTSLFLALLRKILLLIPLALLLPMLWGPTGIFIAEPVADITAAAVTLLMFVRFTRRTFGNNKAGPAREG